MSKRAQDVFCCLSNRGLNTKINIPASKNILANKGYAAAVLTIVKVRSPNLLTLRMNFKLLFLSLLAKAHVVW